MTYPSRFYYTEQSSEAEYSSNPQGSLVVERLINGRAPWKKNVSRQKKQKSLILADWTAAHWSSAKIKETVTLLNQLIDDGFPIYIWQDGALIPYSKELSLEEQALREAIRPALDEQIQSQALAQYKNLTASNLIILDDYELNQLREKNPEEQPPRILDVSDLLNREKQLTKKKEDSVKIKKDSALILSILKTKRPPISKIIHSEFSPGANNLVIQLQSYFPSAPIEGHFRKLVIDAPVTEDEFAFLYSFLHESIEELSLDDAHIALSLNDLRRLINHFPNLKRLELINFTQLKDITPDLHFSLPNLESFTLSLSLGLSLPTSTLKHFLSSAPKLKNIELKDLILSGNDLILAANEHNHFALENLKLVNVSVEDVKILRGLINNAPHIEHVDFDCVDWTPTWTEPLMDHMLPSLKRYAQVRGQTTKEHIKAVLMSPLKEVDLRNCLLEVLTEADIPEKLLFLEQLNLSTATLSPELLITLLTRVPHLKKLGIPYMIFNGPRGLSDVMPLEGLQLPELEELDVSSEISDCISFIIRQSPKLKVLKLRMDGKEPFSGVDLYDALQSLYSVKTLDLGFCGLLTLPEDAVLNFPLLERVLLKYNTVSTNTLHKLLKNVPSLSELELPYNDDGSLTTEIFDLPKLKKLDGSASSLHVKELEKLLNGAPNIRELNLSSHRFVEDINYPLELVPLERLEELNLAYSKCLVSVMHRLWSKAPNLKSLHLNSAKLSSLSRKELELPSSLEVLSLRDCHMSNEQLLEIFNTLPNLKELDLTNISIKGSVQSKVFFAGPPVGVFIEKLSLSNSYAGPMLLKISNFKELNYVVGAKSGFDLPTVAKNIPFHFPQLEKLTLEGYSSEEECLIFLESAPNLKEIVLSGTLIDEWSEETRKKIHALKIKVVSNGKAQPKKQSSAPAVGDSQSEPIERPNRVRAPALPRHDPRSHLDITPEDEDFQFRFRGSKKTLDQGMIIEKCSQFLTITNQHTHLIAKMQKGVCNALSHCFLEKKDWEAFIKRLVDWDGRLSTLNTALRTDFDDLLKQVQKHQFEVDKPLIAHYLGDNLKALLEQEPSSVVFHNPWHAIAVRYEKGTWTLYDPNDARGARVLSDVKTLVEGIQHSLGGLVFVAKKTTIAPLIKNANTFLRDGGLLALAQADNKKAMLALLNVSMQYDEAALEGLLLRNNKGEPAWLSALNHPKLIKLTLTLLTQFKKQKPDYLTALQKSLEALTSLKRHEVIVLLTQLSTAHPTHTALLKELAKKISPLTPKDYRKELETWRKPSGDALSLGAYCQQLVAPHPNKKHLALVDSMIGSQGLSLALISHCHSTSRPVFPVQSPDDLVCAASWIERSKDNRRGRVRPGPGGPLFEFLKKHQGQSPVLVVNYDAFKPDDLVRFNALLDKERLADKTPLTSDVIVVGIMNDKAPEAYQGADFYSRFNRVGRSPIPSATLAKEVPKPPPELKSGQDAFFIDLAHSRDWKERLLGRWLIQKDQLVFAPGLLEQALKANKPICLQNAPWQDPAFQSLWHQAMSYGVLHAEGQTFAIPKELTWYQKEGYDWALLKSRVTFSNTAPPASALIMNQGLLRDLFYTYRCDPTANTLETLPGLLEQHRGSTISLYLTGSLTEEEWGRVLDACDKYEVTLQCHIAQGVTLPEDLGKDISSPVLPPMTTWNPKEKANPLIIHSQEISLTKALITQNEPDWIVIDVSECDASLLNSLDGSFNAQTLNFVFKEQLGVVRKALENNKKVLLHGYFSQELIDHLAPILLKPLAQGQLVLISEQEKAFNYYPVRQHQSTFVERCSTLSKMCQASKEEIEVVLREDQEQSFDSLRAHLIHRRAFPNIPSNPWAGTKTSTPLAIAPFDKEQAKEKAKAFLQDRLHKVNALLAKAPYVFLTGPTAVGKSSFVEHHLAHEPGVTLYPESRMKEWAQDTSETQKILFIDEANITSRQWSEMEGLFNTPPGMLIDGVYYPLSVNHKVVFAGNPLSYGGERQVAPFLARHGHAIEFAPLSAEFIYEYSLAPLFKGTPLETHCLDLVERFFEVYQFIGQQSQQEVLISPRELQMMALFLISYAEQHPNRSVQEYRLAAEHYAYRLGAPLNKKAGFDERFKPKAPLPVTARAAVSHGDFLVTPSRQAVCDQLNDVLGLREWRREKATNNIQRSSGLGGVVLEGEPGIGKSELVMNTLRARGYEEVHDLDNASFPQHAFYRMPVSLSLDEKQRSLLKAFHEGIVVLVDEINSSAMMERLLNDLLMGKTPDKKPALKPGFLVIGTQNPKTMAGRQAMTAPLARRLINTTLPPYSNEEMQEILVAKKVSPEDAQVMVSDYQANRERAIRERLTPIPSFRDLTNLAERIVGHAVSLVNETSKVEAPKVEVPKVVSLSEKIKNLQAEINNLKSYGEQLGNKKEGEKAIQCAKTLHTLSARCFDSSIPSKERIQHRKDFKEALDSSYQKLKTHRSFFSACLSAIARAFRACFGGKPVLSQGSFFDDTARQRQVRKIAKIWDAKEEQASKAKSPK